MNDTSTPFNRPAIAVPLAIPILLTTDGTRAQLTYKKIGFEVIVASSQYLIMRGFGCELHMSEVSHIPKPACVAAYLRVADVGSMFRTFRQFYPTLAAPTAKPWGLSEFHWIDEDGNLLTVGQLLR